MGLLLKLGEKWTVVCRIVFSMHILPYRQQ